MTTQRRTAAAASALATLALGALAGGCGSGFESNQGACKRAINQLATCGSASVDLPPEFDFFISQLCATVPETSECDDWPALADCMAAVSCVEFFSFDPQTVEACNDIAASLENNGCVPGGL